MELLELNLPQLQLSDGSVFTQDAPYPIEPICHSFTLRTGTWRTCAKELTV